MAFSRRRVPILPITRLHIDSNCPFSKVDEFKYLLSSDLTWARHITNICNKTRKLIGMFYRNFYKYSSKDTSLKLYKSLIRPHLEYAPAIWNPHTLKTSKALKMSKRLHYASALRAGIYSNYNSLLLSVTWI